jgi:hypothetical protein
LIQVLDSALAIVDETMEGIGGDWSDGGERQEQDTGAPNAQNTQEREGNRRPRR